MTRGPLRKKRDRRERPTRRLRGRGGRRLSDVSQHPVDGLRCPVCGTEVLPTSERKNGLVRLTCPVCNRLW